MNLIKTLFLVYIGQALGILAGWSLMATLMTLNLLPPVNLLSVDQILKVAALVPVTFNLTATLGATLAVYLGTKGKN
jgi:hypothetical protein